MSGSEAVISYEFRRARLLRSTGGELHAKDKGASAAPGASVMGKLPRVTRLLALAHKFEAMLARGEVGTMAELAANNEVRTTYLSI